MVSSTIEVAMMDDESKELVISTLPEVKVVFMLVTTVCELMLV